MPTPSPLSGQLVTIFGGSGYIGNYVAQSLLARGARVRLASRNPQKGFALKPLANLGQLQFVPCDITRESHVAAALEGASHAVNLVGAFTMAQAVAKRVVAAGSRSVIINVTSMNGIVPGPNSGAYTSAKAGLALLTKQMAVEWGPLGIRVNAIAPGLMDAGMSNAIHADQEIRRSREAKIPARRLGQATDISNLVSFLASDKASYITGENILVDGGITMSVLTMLPRPKSVDKVGSGE